MKESVKQLPVLKKRLLSTLQKRQHNTAFGAAGEQRAQHFLLNNNFQIIDTNVRVGAHEVDIIALDPTTKELVFIEVKTRKTAFFGNPSAAVTQAKLQSLRQVARAYLQTHSQYIDFRIDVLAVLPTEVFHYQNVTWYK